jgi:serine/threonine-protein kinase
VDAGTRLGQYRVVTLLGAGGMGQVYKAVDTNLHREIALKVLPVELAQHADRLMRLRSEARALAALSHPNIAAIHSLEEADGVSFVVMELIEGQNLAMLLRRGKLELRVALEICRQIAEGLEAAHRKGIIHRDLKPSNVMVTAEHVVKLVDFGLAKALAPPEPPSSPDATVRSSDSTASGTVLGTAQYMSPEQVRAQPVDERTDVWAFGCVLYEVLTGERAFDGATNADTVAKILESDAQWDRLPPSTPPVVQALQRRCLDKSVRHRLQDIGDARVMLEEVLRDRTSTPDGRLLPVSDRPFPYHRLAWLAAALGIAAAAAILGQRLATRPPVPPMRTFDVALPAGRQLVGPPAFSPDGQRLVFAAAPQPSRLDASLAPTEEAPGASLYVRSIVTGETAPIARTDGASFPFFSPDGAWIGFFAGGELKKVPVRGGEPVALCEVRGVSRAAWGPDNRIFFSPSTSKALAWVSPLGGAPEFLPAPEGAPVGLDSPEVLPGGEALLLRVFSGRESPLGVLSLRTGRLVTLRERGIEPRYVPSGHIVYIRGGGLMAVPFDLRRLEVTGPETQVVPNVVQYAVSQDGSLVYRQGDAAQQKVLVWVDRAGKETPLEFPAAGYGSFQLSPDGTRVAIEVEGATMDVWVYDLVRGGRTRLTNAGNNGAPGWTPDGERVVFSSNRGKTFGLYSAQADGSSEPQQLPSTSIPVWHAWSPDGRYLAITDVSLGKPDIWILGTAAGSKPAPLRTSGSSEWGAAFSPDGRWIAYASDESGRFEVYLEPAPGQAAERRRVSSSGGEEPRWSRKTGELFYRSGRKWMVVPVVTHPSLTVGTPRMLFEGDYLKVSGIPYDVAADGQRVLVLKPSREREAAPILRVVVGWQTELERRVGAR